MAITYHAGRRIQGLSTDVLEAPTFEDDFDYASQSAGDTVWVRNDTVNNYMRYNDTNKNLDFDQRQDTTNDSISYNLGSALDNTKWVCRMKVVFTTLTAGTNCDLHIGLSSVDSSSSVATTQDYIGIKLKYESAQKEIGTLECQDEAMNKGSDDVTTAGYFVTGTYYFELTRLSSTTYQLTTTKNSPNWDNPDDTLTGTISGSITGLQYIVVRNRLDTGSGRIQGTIDDIEIYDGVSSLTNKPTNVQSGSRFEETDTRKIYYYPTLSFQDDYSTNTGWTSTNGAIAVDGSDSNKCIMTNGDASNDVRVYKSLSLTLNNTKWCVDFDYKQTDQTPRAGAFPVCLTAGTSEPDNATQDMIGVKAFTSTQTLRLIYKDGAGAVTSNDTNPVTIVNGTQYYCRLIRSADNTTKLEVYSDSNRSTLVGSQTTTSVPTTVTELTHIQHAIQSGSAGDLFNFEIDNTKIYNNAISPTSWTEEA
jgi:hypothetical protein